MLVHRFTLVIWVNYGLVYGKNSSDQTEISLDQAQNSLDQISNVDAYRKRWVNHCLNFDDDARSDDDHGKVDLVHSFYDDVLTLN